MKKLPLLATVVTICLNALPLLAANPVQSTQKEKTVKAGRAGGTSKAVVIHGHRGSRGTHPENTIPAFEEAVKAGAQVLELDLQLTRDDVPVIAHDAELGALCTAPDGTNVNQPVAIRTLTWSEVKKYECGRRPNHARFPEQKSIDGVHIPSLDEFLAWAKKNAPGLEYNIETKMTAKDPAHVADPSLFASKVVELLRQHGAVKKTILQSFDFRTLRAARQLEPTLRLSCLFEDARDFCEPTAAEHAVFASPHWEKVTPEEVKRCHARGIQVVPWTANDEKSWEHLLHCGVDAIITDYPRKLSGYLKHKPAH